MIATPALARTFSNMVQAPVHYPLQAGGNAGRDRRGLYFACKPGMTFQTSDGVAFTIIVPGGA